MINYYISYEKPHRHYVDFKLIIDAKNEKKIKFQLAAWRPGRYELGNFSQNISKWRASNENNEYLNFKKITKDLWEVEAKSSKKIIITYSFYANQLDAGSCYLDEYQLYLNPVHCIFYVVGRENELFNIKLDLPQNYQIATSLKKSNNLLIANNYDELAESPFICSNSLQYNKYSVNNIDFHLWFQGKCKIDWGKIKKDFYLFTKTQIEHFNGFPVDEYHFLFQITPYRSYHGVEHTKNTVLLLGPSDKIMNEKYEDLLGVCSHELYHTWNIKAIRPKEMLPYDYTKENYFRTGFVAEGVTTYMGDLMLYKSGVFNWIEFVKTQNQNLERHLMNYGRFNLSVADSGFDNWLDGYKLGAPNRKVSIYPDGALCMLMVDLEIIKNTDGKYSLNSVMKELYDDYALNGLGYSENDFRNICVKYGSSEIVKIFESHIYGVKDYVPTLEKSLQIVGLNLKEKLNPNISAQYFGFIATKENGKYIIKKVEPNSIADINIIGPEDEIKEINNKKIDKPLNNILKDCKKEVSFTIKNKFSEKIMNLSCGNYYKLLEIDTVKNISTKQLKLRKIWCNK
tara:strand:+ start:22715 stop:24421 length:1707 start_codon:yes stop_codon:yes gene_type:complete